MKKAVIISIIFACLLVGIAFALPAKLLPVQGKLTNKLGVPLSGTYNITFSIYAGSTALWTETKQLMISKGMFSTVLGDTTMLNMDFSNDYDLAISINGESMGRQRLLPAPYAMFANVAGGVQNNTELNVGLIMSNGPVIIKGSDFASNNSHAIAIGYATGGNQAIAFGGTNDPAIIRYNNSMLALLTSYFVIQQYNESSGVRYNKFYVDEQGRVGIGTVPSEKLDVLGKAKAQAYCIGTSCITSWPETPLQLNLQTLTISENASISGNLSVAGSGSFGEKVQSNSIVQVGRYSSKPTCNLSQQGGFVYDTVIGKPFVCNGTVWKPLDSDFDSDGITDAIDRDDSNPFDSTAVAADVKSGRTFYSGGKALTGTWGETYAGWAGSCIYKAGDNACPANYPQKTTVYSGCSAASCTSSGGGYWVYEHAGCNGWSGYLTSTSCDNWLLNHNDQASSSRAEGCGCTTTGGSATGQITICCS